MTHFISPACLACGAPTVHKLMLEKYPPPTEEQITKAENRWICLRRYHAFHGGPAESCHECCPGRDAVVADDATWAEFKKGLRTKQKKTVLDGYAFDPAGYLGLYPTTPYSQAQPLEIDRAFLPKDGLGLRGKWTIIVTIEPEDDA